MLLLNKKLCIASLLLFSISNSFVAQNKPKSLTNFDEYKLSSPSLGMTAKSVEIQQSERSFEITTNKGLTATLPYIDKLLVDSKIHIPSANILYNSVNSFSQESLDNLALVRKEMQELSRELGISISDKVYLDLYREVVYWLGVPYRTGGMSHKAVDCSGFTSLIYKTIYDIKLPRTSSDMANNVMETVTKENLEPGDLVFFSTRGKKRINHVGIYLGERKFIHASIGKGVMVDSLDDRYYTRSWKKGGRVY